MIVLPLALMTHDNMLIKSEPMNFLLRVSSSKELGDCTRQGKIFDLGGNPTHLEANLDGQLQYLKM